MFLPESIDLRSQNPEYSSDKDSDYEPPDYVQEKNHHERPIFTRSMATANLLEKEEALRRLFGTKINRYPLRHYINLDSGFDIHLRPNYYESDHEEEEENKRQRRRRHSISELLWKGEEEEEHNQRKIKRQRRYSEGSNISVFKKHNEVIDTEGASLKQISKLNTHCKSRREPEPGSVCITRTLTYTSKKQIIKLYQTEHLNADFAQDITVSKQIYGDKASPNTQYVLKDTVDKQNHETNSENEVSKKEKPIKSKSSLLSYKNKNYVSSREQPRKLREKTKYKAHSQCIMQYKNRHTATGMQEHTENINTFLQRKKQNISVQNNENKSTTVSQTNKKADYLAQLGLKRFRQSGFEKNVCKKKLVGKEIVEKCTKLPSEIQILGKEGPFTQNNSDCETNRDFQCEYKKYLKNETPKEKTANKTKISLQSSKERKLLSEKHRKLGAFPKDRVKFMKKTIDTGLQDKPDVDQEKLKLNKDVASDKATTKVSTELAKRQSTKTTSNIFDGISTRNIKTANIKSKNIQAQLRVDKTDNISKKPCVVNNQKIKSTNLKSKTAHLQLKIDKTDTSSNSKNIEQKGDKKNVSRRKIPTYHEVIRRACENLFKPDLIVKKDSAMVKKMSSELNNKKFTGVNQFTSADNCLEKAPGTEVTDEKIRSNESHTNSEKIAKFESKRQEKEQEVTMSSKNSTSQGVKKSPYNIEDIERKLQHLFADSGNEKLLKKAKEEVQESISRDNKSVTKNKEEICCTKSTHPDRHKCKEKPAEEYVSHKKKSNTEKRTKRELEKVKQQTFLCQTENLNLEKSNCKSNSLLKDKIKHLKEQRRALCRVKSILKENLQQTTNNCPENFSNFVLHKLNGKTTEHMLADKEKQSVEKLSSDKIIDRDHLFTKQSKSEHLEAKNNSKQKDSEIIISSASENIKETGLNIIDTEKSLPFNELQIKFNGTKRKEEQGDATHLKCNNIECIDIIKDCCCCSPSSVLENSPNEKNGEKVSESNSTLEEEQPLDNKPDKLFQETEKVEIIYLCDNSSDETVILKKPDPDIVTCCCCSPQTVPEKLISTNIETGSEKVTEKSTQFSLLLSENLTIDITGEEDLNNSNETNYSLDVKSKVELESEIIILDDNEIEINSHNGNPSKSDVEGSIVSSVSGERESVTALEASGNSTVPDDATTVILGDIVKGGSSSQILVEDMFPEEFEEDHDLRDLIETLTESIDTRDNSPWNNENLKTGTKCIENDSNIRLINENIHLKMTEMEHYKKRLIHQHEKPRTLSSPYTTTEEEEDSLLESPASPASSVQSRESGQRRREEAVQKVARKRAVCRSQFRHRNMELFKLGTSIPTSLCKAKEPYNVCTEKNLQMCHQNGGSKKCDKNIGKGSLTESILNSMEGSKSKDIPLWRSVSLNNEISQKQNVHANDNASSGSGRHILPAIVPELPDRRKSRVKSLPENSSKNLTSNLAVQITKNSSERPSGNVYEFSEENDRFSAHKTEHVGATNKKPDISEKKARESYKEPTQVRDIAEAHKRNVSTSTTSDSDAAECSPINLSLKNRETVTNQHTWTDLLNIHQTKRNEVNNNQYLTCTIPRQPNNVPKKPSHIPDHNLEGSFVKENDGGATLIDKNLDRNCVYVTAIPSNALDPQQQSNVIVINFPNIQQQVSRMEKPTVMLPNPVETQQSPVEMLDSAIMSLVNIVKSSVESVFSIMSLPVLNRLYIDLNRYLLLPSVSVKMKRCIEEALNALISYILINLFHAPRTSKTRSFVHKLLQLDLRPHMNFFINSLDVIQQKIRYETFMDHLLKVLSRNPQEDAPMYFPKNVNICQGFPPPHFPNQTQQCPPDFRNFRNRFLMENLALQYRNGVMEQDLLRNVPHAEAQKRSRPQTREADTSLGAGMRMPENFGAPNLAMMRPDFYLADNRCIPPKDPRIHPEAYFMNAPGQGQARPLKNRPRNSTKTNRTHNRLTDNSGVLPPQQLGNERTVPEGRQTVDRRARNVPNVANNDNSAQIVGVGGKNGKKIPNCDVLATGKTIRRNSDVAAHRQGFEENMHFSSRSQFVEERRRLSDGALIANSASNLLNGSDLQQVKERLLRREQKIANYEMGREVKGENIVKDDLQQHSGNGGLTRTRKTPANSDNNQNILNRKALSNEILNRTEMKPRHLLGNNSETALKVPSGGKASNKVVHQNEELEAENASKNTETVRRSDQDKSSSRDTFVKQCAVPDVEEFLQTNIIVNKSQTNGCVTRELVRENVTLARHMEDNDNLTICEKTNHNCMEKVTNTGESSVMFETRSDENPTSDSGDTNRISGLQSSELCSENKCKKPKTAECSENYLQQLTFEQSVEPHSRSEVVSNAVIIKDTSMEISKGDSSHSTNKEACEHDVVLEKVGPNIDFKNGISYSCAWSSEFKTNGRPTDTHKGITGGSFQEKRHLVTDVSIEKVTDEFDTPPKLIRLATLKRKVTQDDKQQAKKANKEPHQLDIKNSHVIIMKDNEKGKRIEKLDYNQNDVSKAEKSPEKTVKESNEGQDKSDIHLDAKTKSFDTESNTTVAQQQSITQPAAPIIEDISSDEEVFEPFQLYSCYENKISGDPRKILETTEVSHCTLIEGSVKAIQNANRHLFEKPPVYTKPVLPWELRKPPAEATHSTNVHVENDTSHKRELLANLVQFEEDSETLTCSFKVKNNSELKYPRSINVRRFSPASTLQVAVENVSPVASPPFTDKSVPVTPNFKSPTRAAPVSPGVSQMPSAVPRSPVVQTSPVGARLAAVETPRMVPRSPVVQMSPLLSAAPPLDESRVNWRHWFSEEQRKGVFNFERSQSMDSATLSGRQSVEAPSSAGSDYGQKFSPDQQFCEIKMDSKVYKIKRSLLDKIPKGKLCYVRESNTFIRYFDDNQMELFVKNLNMGEGSMVAKDLLKQVRGHAEGPFDIEISPAQHDGSRKGEILTLSKDVIFSSEDFLSDPELYVEEVEKVQRFVPKDFYGFYKFVTGYQIINHHPPISFQTFLTMHNTNGIRGLFKNYVNTLIEGRNII